MMEDLLNFLQPNLSKVVSTQLSGQNTHVLGVPRGSGHFPSGGGWEGRGRGPGCGAWSEDTEVLMMTSMCLTLPVPYFTWVLLGALWGSL